MRFLLLGIIGLLLVFLAGHLFLRADPKALAKRAKPIGLGLAVVLAIVLFLTGRWAMAQRVLAGAFGFLGPFSPFGSGPSGGGGTPGSGTRRPGTSRVRTALVEMELDHATGEMHGRVVRGRFAGKTLDGLDLGDLAALHAESRAAGDQSEAVLAAWLDRTHPDWRDDGRFAAAGAGGSGAKGDGGARQSSAMNREEACGVLGLEPDASDDDIRKAHKRLMKQFHPDQGGSDYLASKINEAKDVLLKQ